MSSIQFVAVMFVLVVIVLLVAYGTVALRRSISYRVTYTVDLKLEETIKGLAEATAHRVQVAAVVEMVRQLDNDPSAVQHLKSYPIAVQRAALAHYADQLGQALRIAQHDLAEGYKLKYPSSTIKHRQERIDEIRAKLNALVAAAA